MLARLRKIPILPNPDGGTARGHLGTLNSFLGAAQSCFPGSPSDSRTGSQWVMLKMIPEQAEMRMGMRAEAHWISWQYFPQISPHRQLWSRGSALLGIYSSHMFPVKRVRVRLPLGASFPPCSRNRYQLLNQGGWPKYWLLPKTPNCSKWFDTLKESIQISPIMGWNKAFDFAAS